MEQKTCGVESCKETGFEGWIDIWENKDRFGRLFFCKEHYNKIVAFAEAKLAEAKLKDSSLLGWAYMPMEIVEEALAEVQNANK